MLRRILKYIFLATVCVLVVGLSSAFLFRKYLQHKVAGQRAITSPQGIDSLGPVRIGGINQWIQVRGEDVNNPILLFIHGVPGVAFIPLAGSFQGPWEKYFTVVEWDQRGAGKDIRLEQRRRSAQHNECPSNETRHNLRRELSAPSFSEAEDIRSGTFMGECSGTFVGASASGTPLANVGIGQVIDMRQNDAVAYQDALKEAHRVHNKQALRDLEGTAPEPTADPRKQQLARYWEGELLAPPSQGAQFVNVKRILTDVVSAPEYSLADDYGFIRGQALSLSIFLPQLSTLNLKQLGSDFRVPIFFFEGRHDPFCRPSLIWQYSQTIKTPQKEFVWFDNSGHLPFFEDKQKFTQQLVQRVLPLAVSRSGM